MAVGFVVYTCLFCGYEEGLKVAKGEYSEVKVCPKCNGAFVDRWHIGKHLRPTKDGTCENGYSKNINKITVEVDIDCVDVIRRLKVIQREAKMATTALKELEKQQAKLSFDFPTWPEVSD